MENLAVWFGNLERAALCYGTPRPDDVIDWLLTVHYERLRDEKASLYACGACKGGKLWVKIHAIPCMACMLDAPTDRTNASLRSQQDVLCVECRRSETQDFEKSEVIVKRMCDTLKALFRVVSHRS
jgi:O-succinylbenzoate synthase